MEDQSSEVNRQCRDSSALHSKYILTLHFKYILLELKGEKNLIFLDGNSKVAIISVILS